MERAKQIEAQFDEEFAQQSIFAKLIARMQAQLLSLQTRVTQLEARQMASNATSASAERAQMH